MDDGASGGGADCLPGPLSLPLHPGNSGPALVKQTCSLGLWEPVSPPGPWAVAVFLLGSQGARRGQVGPALRHGDLAVSVPCIIVQRLLWLRDCMTGTAERAGQGSARGRFSLSGPVRVAGKTGCAGRASGAGVVVGRWGVPGEVQSLVH